MSNKADITTTLPSIGFRADFYSGALIRAKITAAVDKHNNGVCRIIADCKIDNMSVLVDKICKDLALICDMNFVNIDTRGDEYRDLLLIGEDIMINIELHTGTNPTTIDAYSSSAEIAERYCKLIADNIPTNKVNRNPNVIPFAFWRFCKNTGQAAWSIRDLDCPSWDTIKHNYSRRVQDAFDYLVSLERPDEHGKIVLLHGPPGTGKTYWVRSFVRELFNRLYATTEIILDYERVFSDADYMHSVLLDDDIIHSLKLTLDHKYNKTSDSITESPLRVVVIEDGASLFSTNCRNTEGFSRFLNMSDGIVGQGLRTLFILTANEDLESEIDPAVYRTGRCLKEIRFDNLDRDRIIEWCELNQINPPVENELSLAQLYGHLQGNKHTGKPNSKFGFDC